MKITIRHGLNRVYLVLSVLWCLVVILFPLKISRDVYQSRESIANADFSLCNKWRSEVDRMQRVQKSQKEQLERLQGLQGFQKVQKEQLDIQPNDPVYSAQECADKRRISLDE